MTCKVKDNLSPDALAFAVWKKVNSGQKSPLDYISFKNGFFAAIQVCSDYSLTLEAVKALEEELQFKEVRKA
jgi:hypothetical protein